MEYWQDGNLIVIETEEGTIDFAFDETGLFCFQTGDARVDVEGGFGCGYERTDDIEPRIEESTIYYLPCGRIAMIEKLIAFGPMVVIALERDGEWLEAIHVLEDPVYDGAYEVGLYGDSPDCDDEYRVFIGRGIERRI